MVKKPRGNKPSRKSGGKSNETKGAARPSAIKGKLIKKPNFTNKVSDLKMED